MNELATWANQYEQLASVTDLINESVNILIKEKLIHQHPGLSDRPSFQLSDTVVNEARTNVANLIGSLVDDTPGNPSSDSDGPANLPDDLLDDYRHRLEGNPDARDRFAHLHTVLQSADPVGEEDKVALDDLVLTLNNSRKQIFRKLRQNGSQ